MYNVGGLDKILRIVIGFVLLVIALDGEHFFGHQIVWAWIGLIPLVTGILSFCPTYRLVGFTTYNPEENI